MTTTPSTSDLTDEEKGKVGFGNPPVLAETSETVLSGRGLIKTFGRVVGLDGVAVTDLRPAGLAQIGAERVDVITEGEYVAQGTPVRVLRSEGYRHIVRGIA